MIKVLFTSHRDVFSGAEQVLVDYLNNSILNQGFKFYIFAKRDSCILRKINNENVIQIEFENLNAYSDYVGFISKFYYFKHLFESCIELNKVIKAEGIDIVHHNTMYAAVKFLPQYFMGGKLKYLFTMHDIFEGGFKRILFWISALIYRNIIYVSQATKNKANILSFFGGYVNTAVIHNSCLLRRAGGRLGVKKNFHIVGMLCEWKGQDAIVDYWCLNKINSDLFLYGDGDFQYIEKIRKISENSENVKLMGHVSAPLESLSGESFNILIHCSIKDDPFPTVVLEAIANNVLPIVSRYGGAIEALDPIYRSILSFDPCDYSSIDNRIRFIMNLNSAEFEKILMILRRYAAENFTHENKALKLLNFYNTLI